MNRKHIIDSIFWRFMERSGAQGVSLIVSIILARLLDPSVYGIIAIVTIFTSILQVFVDSGLGNALIQKKDADDIDFTSVFVFNIIICVVLYIIIFFVSPIVASFFSLPNLTPLIRVLSISLIISGLKNVQQAYIAKRMLFRKFFYATIGGTFAAAIVGIWMAFNGFGVWSLVIQTLVNMSIDTIILWFTVKWRPKGILSLSRLRNLFSYGWKLLVSSLLETVYKDIRSIIIGKMYTPNDLAYTSKGEQFPNLFVSNINSSLDSVLFPAMASEQNDTEKIKAITRRAIKVSTFIMMPIMMGFAVVAEPLVRVLLTDKWLPIIPFLRIYCFTYAFYPIHTANLNAIKAHGNSGMFLKLEVYKKILGILVLISSMWFGVYVMTLSLIPITVINIFINAFPNKKTIKYSISDLIKDILPSINMSILMGFAVSSITLFGLSDWVTLIIQIPLGICIYLFTTFIFYKESISYFFSILRDLTNK